VLGVAQTTHSPGKLPYERTKGDLHEGGTPYESVLGAVLCPPYGACASSVSKNISLRKNNGFVADQMGELGIRFRMQDRRRPKI
jgi:hypothetical protein